MSTTRERILIQLPLPPQACHPNARPTWRMRANAVRIARRDAHLATIGALGGLPGPEWKKVTARATFTYPVVRDRDDDSLIAQLKASRDQIAETLGMESDNGWTWLTPVVVVDKAAQSGVVVEIWEAK